MNPKQVEQPVGQVEQDPKESPEVVELIPNMPLEYHDALAALIASKSDGRK